MKKRITFLVIAFLIGNSSLILAQSYKIVNESSTLSVLGTSTLHDWKINADTIIGEATLIMDGKELKDISTLTINIPITSMHSGLAPMDVHMRTAMTANKSNAVEFKLNEIKSLTPNTIEGYTVQADGEVTIITNKKSVGIQATLEFRKNGEIRFFGETMLDMTDYEVELPQAEMGSIKSEKDVKIVFDVVFSKN